ncbi:hypothetical protein V8C40DRAFT_4496 [Trichoderma camerunense]
MVSASQATMSLFRAQRCKISFTGLCLPLLLFNIKGLVTHCTTPEDIVGEDSGQMRGEDSCTHPAYPTVRCLIVGKTRDIEAITMMVSLGVAPALILNASSQMKRLVKQRRGAIARHGPSCLSSPLSRSSYLLPQAKSPLSVKFCQGQDEILLNRLGENNTIRTIIFVNSCPADDTPRSRPRPPQLRSGSTKPGIGDRALEPRQER